MKSEERTTKHVRNKDVEDTLIELEQLLGPVGTRSQKRFKAPDYPTIFIVGCARSGTTLINQVLVKYLDCCYPTNFLSRFYYAPYVGALLQKLMFDLDFKGELLNNFSEIPVSSLLGKTKGPLSPNEFWYFWRKHFEFGAIQKLDESNINQRLAKEFENALYSIQHVFDKPLLLKGMIMNWNIPFLHKLIKNSFFIYIERDISYNAQSLLLARKEFFNDEKKWYSFMPEEYNVIKNKEAEEQVVAQVFYTNRAIKNGLQQIDASRYIQIDYSEFCDNPLELIEEIRSWLNLQKKKSSFKEEITKNQQVKVNKSVWDKIVMYSQMYSELQ